MRERNSWLCFIISIPGSASSFQVWLDRPLIHVRISIVNLSFYFIIEPYILSIDLTQQDGVPWKNPSQQLVLLPTTYYLYQTQISLTLRITLCIGSSSLKSKSSSRLPEIARRISGPRSCNVRKPAFFRVQVDIPNR